MLDIGWSELLVIAVVAIVVIGPKDLPRTLRAVGQWTGRIKRMAREFQGQFTEAIREAELDAVQRDLEELTKIDPVADLRAAAEKTGDDIKRDLQKTALPPNPREPYPWEAYSNPGETAAAVVPPQPASAPDPTPPPAPNSAPAAAEPKP
jgi:sec-independent protein translocase protein TatB